ncbi:MAG: hypothetical protein HZB15_10290 [Actinobacteria bacterium]|nr:hypothetical protein [Actinomycetota bacterium]
MSQPRGPGNESVTPWLVFWVIGESDGLSTIPTTALVGFLFTTLQQMASGTTALAGFSTFEETARSAWASLRGDDDVAPLEWSRLGWWARIPIVFALGTTAVALTQIMSTGHVGVRRHLPVIAKSALLCGTVVGLLGAMVASLAVIGRRWSRAEGTTDWLLDVLGSPLLWLSLVVLLAIVHFVRRWLRSTDAGDD